ncbi:hypothetical protein N7474_009163 [Penicillium riverlandense]|uniref:uncharacterized protein n=1 Tax=Penicillium riverlandense TaxID=1903569 RepID=UPI002546875A|nr:uncharacterized protein N7474_009163 [Penicillium riverlandense]KAJ5807894.1 hypothetical protein N7474_009163 [Penicillium riverlandense]
MSSSAVQISQPPSTNPAPPVSTSASPPAVYDIVRCSRCQQSLAIENKTSPGAVQFGMNSYYCNRCASKVGFGR